MGGVVVGVEKMGGGMKIERVKRKMCKKRGGRRRRENKQGIDRQMK